jgi:pilus assembly protein CpaB
MNTLINQLQGWRPQRNTWILAVSVLLGLLAAYGVQQWMSQRLQELSQRAKGKPIELVVAKTDLAKGTALNSSHAAVRSVPEDFGHSDAIRPEQFDSVEGQVLTQAIKAGEMLMWGLLEGHKNPVFAHKVGPQRRAITVAVDEINSLSGLLEPGDQIDLLMTLEIEGRKRTFTLLQGVTVMATGQRTVDQAAGGERRHYNTVTLDTSPMEARDLVIARDHGRLTALLRNPSEPIVQHKRKLDLESLLHLHPRTAPVAASPVPVLYGGTQAAPAGGMPALPAAQAQGQRP